MGGTGSCLLRNVYAAPQSSVCVCGVGGGDDGSGGGRGELNLMCN